MKYAKRMDMVKASAIRDSKENSSEGSKWWNCYIFCCRAS